MAMLRGRIFLKRNREFIHKNDIALNKLNKKKLKRIEPNRRLAYSKVVIRIEAIKAFA